MKYPEMWAINRHEFDLYHLFMPYGPNFAPYHVVQSWSSPDNEVIASVLENSDAQDFKYMIIARRTDQRFRLVHEAGGFSSPEDALINMDDSLANIQPPLALLPGERRRPDISDVGQRRVGDKFKLISTSYQHAAARVVMAEVYRAMPNPDDNFISDFQTANFDARLWEMYLFACFKEQGVKVEQNVPSPDFLLSKDEHICWVEAVSINPNEEVEQKFPKPVPPPKKLEDRLAGNIAERFAKTLHSKIQRKYEELDHVKGSPFAIAIADYHASGSMVWSREALPTYLYGKYAKAIDTPEGRKATEIPLKNLLGDLGIPAGLFNDPTKTHISAIIFSNSSTISKFNRMGLQAGLQMDGVTMVRAGVVYDRTEGALEPIEFELDVTSEEYRTMLGGEEYWSHELEVYHNPNAQFPLCQKLLMAATHWFEKDGEIICTSIYDNPILASMTLIQVDPKKLKMV